MFLFYKVTVLLSCALLTGCLSYGDYAVKYRVTQNIGPGLVSSKALKKEGRAAIQKSEKEAAEQKMKQRYRCQYFRNQLVVASEKAQSHRFWIWAGPWYWPLHVMTLFLFPVEETQKANWVLKTASQMERSYQQSDEEFLRTCESLEEHPVIGESFIQENPFRK